MKIKLGELDLEHIIKEYYSIANNKHVADVCFNITEDYIVEAIIEIDV